MSTADLGSRASRGASTTMLWQLLRIATQLAGIVLLARLLAPEAFGLIAMVLSLVGIGEILRDFGLTSAAVQARRLDAEQKSNLFWINAGIGGLLTVVVFLAAPAIARLYGHPELTDLARALSLTFVLNGISAQFRAELNRRMRFLALNVVDTLPAMAGLICASVIAYLTESVWALVAQHLVTAVAGVVLVVAVARWWPGLPSRAGHVGSLMRFGGGVLGTQAVAYVTKNVDNVAIGLVWGAGPLGLYSRAYQLLMAPIVQLLAPMTRVALPVLSRLQDERGRFMAFLRRGQLVGSLIAGTVYALVIGLAQPIVLIVFGTEWVDIAPIVQALAFGGIFRALNQVAYWAYLGLGLSGHQFRFYLATQPVIVLFLLAGLPWGPLGVAIGHSIAYALNWFAALWWCGRVTGLNFAPLVRDGLRSTVTVTLPIAALGLGAVALIANPFGAVAVGVLLAAAWLTLTYLCFPPTRTDIRHVFDVIKRVRQR
ncbi:lipopolysaccharide biosynthesis protein [Bogoriella caseilytica]|uniref:PST family polysaccharide transporter n=1 Tax=Bogoriella caseilytica TaxID=56055 RepID=A0A3N2BDM7_9MICO|nr:lipopolysaccharide biosynthesis protein [Bogoriella caseilytica]ROR73342.1 PST family polysaccharide transporter [Bogoriella caseilytica]